MVRKLLRPDRIPGVLPYGPLPEPAGLANALTKSVDIDTLNDSASRWLAAARGEWASLLGEAPVIGQPRFAWQPALGPKAMEQAGAYALPCFWRSVARRVDEMAAVLDR